MDPINEKKYVFNLKLAKLVGLYQILDPDTTKIFGFNLYHVFFAAYSVFITAIVMLCPIGFYYLRNDITVFYYYLACIINHLFGCYKVMNIVYHSRDLWKCIGVTSYYFMSYEHYNQSIFDKWRNRTVKFSSIYFTLIFIEFVVWILNPLVFNDVKISVRNLDGSYNNYNYNIFNYYLIVSDGIYNNNFVIFFIIELIILTGYGFCILVTDMLMVTMCQALSCQLETICHELQSLGYSHDNTDICNDTHLEKDIYINENNLKSILMDHQNVMKIMNDYYKVVQSVTLAQIFFTSCSHVLSWVLIALVFSGDTNITSLLSIKAMVVSPVFAFQLFMPCYLLETINQKSDDIIFALYSINWTAMDLKIKKLILLTMKINNANLTKMKFTRTKIVNLEMFSTSMRTSYSVFSMLVNYKKKTK